MDTRCLADETVLAFVDANVETAEFVAVSAHLNECDDCRRLVAKVARAVYEEATDAPTSRSGGRLPRIPAVGTAIDRYVVSGLLGKGAMAFVFAAFDPQLRRNVALKLLRPDSDEQREDRLLREAQAMAQLTHPNVLRVYDAGTSDGRVFIAMEYVEGTTLARWLREGSRPWQEIVWAFLAAGRGLAAAHAAGIAHRDFKPANVLMSHKGDVLVSDFGLARTFTGGSLTDTLVGPQDPARMIAPITQTGVVIGTPAYMAPEQFNGPADARSDQFAFCVALYQALYGVHPFADALGSGAPSLLGTLAQRPPESSSVPPRIFEALCRGMGREPSARFARMEDLLVAIGAAEPDRPARPAGDRMLVLAIAASTLAVLIALVASVATRSVVSSDRPERAPPPPTAAVDTPAAVVAAPAASPAPRPVAEETAHQVAPPPVPHQATPPKPEPELEASRPPPSARPVEERRPAASQQPVRRARKEKVREAPSRDPPRKRRQAPEDDEEPEGIFRNVYDKD